MVFCVFLIWEWHRGTSSSLHSPYVVCACQAGSGLGKAASHLLSITERSWRLFKGIFLCANVWLHYLTWRRTFSSTIPIENAPRCARGIHKTGSQCINASFQVPEVPPWSNTPAAQLCSQLEKSCWVPVNVLSHSTAARIVLVVMGRASHHTVVLGLGKLQRRLCPGFDDQSHSQGPDRAGGYESHLHPKPAVWPPANNSGFLRLILSLLSWR